jgi:hypothetical protein
MRYAILLLAVTLQVSPLVKQNATKTSAHHADAKRGEQSVPPATASAPIVGEAQSSKTTEKNQLPLNNNEDWTSRWGVYINGALALATFVLAIFAVKQANAAQASADAALLNAQAVMNAERAWIVIGCPMSDFKPSREEDWNPARYVWHIKNAGKTPAILKEVSAVFNLTNALPEKMTLEAWTRSLARKQVVVAGETLPMSVTFKPGSKISRMDMARVRTHDKLLVAYGYVIYSDTFGVEHETRFIHIYNVPPADDALGWEGFCHYADAPDDYYKHS